MASISDEQRRIDEKKNLINLLFVWLVLMKVEKIKLNRDIDGVFIESHFVAFR